MLLRLEDLSVSYPHRGPVLRGVGLEVRRGELTALVGPNGGGKTTLLKTIAGALPGFQEAQVTGRILLEGHGEVRPGDPLLRGLFSLLQPDPEVQVVGLTPLHEALLAPVIRREPRDAALRLAKEALEAMGLWGMRDEPTSLLSTGLLQRTGIAGLLTSKPHALLLDEPTSHLDEPSKKALVEALEELREEGLGIVVAGHDPRLAEEADRVYCVDVTLEECNEGWREWLQDKLERTLPPAGQLEKLLESLPQHKGRPGEVVARIEDADLGYPGRGPVLRGVGLEVRRGELTALVGPNGGGKTTLLKTIAGALRPLRGRVWRGEAPAYLPSEPLLVFSRGSLREELGPRREPPLGLPPSVVDAPVMTLSRGQLQLAALSLVLALSRGGLLLFDEPTFALDEGWARLVLEVLRGLVEKSGYAVVVASHDPRVVSVADRVLRVAEGGVVEE